MASLVTRTYQKLLKRGIGCTQSEESVKSGRCSKYVSKNRRNRYLKNEDVYGSCDFIF